jgi:Family of unknown function (DUF5709)
MSTTPEPPEASEQLDITDEADTLGQRGVEDPLDEGYSPPENWSAGERYGNTAYEELVGESLEQRLAQEEPDFGEGVLGPDFDRAGRLIAGTDGSQYAEDVGIDGGAASAEEAAVHVQPDEPSDWVEGNGNSEPAG